MLILSGFIRVCHSTAFLTALVPVPCLWPEHWCMCVCHDLNVFDTVEFHGEQDAGSSLAIK